MLREPEWREYFGTREMQAHAAQLGMWVFLATEILLFAALFVSFGFYRYLYPQVFHEGSTHLAAGWATVQTLLLVTSSLFVALAVHFAREGRRFSIASVLMLAMLLGAGFLAIKFWEYATHAREGLLPGDWYRFADFNPPGANLFFTLYYLLTGLHAVHMVIGLGVLGWLSFGALRGRYSSGYHVPIEVGGLYWHLVDVFWLFIFPLLYLG